MIESDGFSPIMIINSTVSSNNASYGGGMQFGREARPELHYCNIRFDANTRSRFEESNRLLPRKSSHNNARDDGGGLTVMDNCSIFATNCTFSFNNASAGGGVLTEEGGRGQYVIMLLCAPCTEPLSQVRQLLHSGKHLPKPRRRCRMSRQFEPSIHELVC